MYLIGWNDVDYTTKANQNARNETQALLLAKLVLNQEVVVLASYAMYRTARTDSNMRKY